MENAIKRDLSIALMEIVQSRGWDARMHMDTGFTTWTGPSRCFKLQIIAIDGGWWVINQSGAFLNTGQKLIKEMMEIGYEVPLDEVFTTICNYLLTSYPWAKLNNHRWTATPDHDTNRRTNHS